MKFDSDTKDWLEALTYIVAIATPLVGGLVFLLSKRRADIVTLTTAIARGWTNEGDVSSDEPFFVDLALELMEGDIVGTLSFSNQDELLEAHVDVHWRSATLRVSRLVGRSAMPVGKVKLTLVGNRNRLNWKVKKEAQKSVLPKRTLLWPHVQPAKPAGLTLADLEKVPLGSPPLPGRNR